MKLGSAQLMKLFSSLVFSCGDLDNQKQSRIGNLLQVLQWMLALWRFETKIMLPVNLNLFCLSNMKNVGRNFPCLVSAHGQISSFLCSKFQLIYHGRLPGPSEGNYKDKKTQQKRTKTPNQQQQNQNYEFTSL